MKKLLTFLLVAGISNLIVASEDGQSLSSASSSHSASSHSLESLGDDDLHEYVNLMPALTSSIRSTAGDNTLAAAASGYLNGTMHQITSLVTPTSADPTDSTPSRHLRTTRRIVFNSRTGNFTERIVANENAEIVIAPRDVPQPLDPILVRALEVLQTGVRSAVNTTSTVTTNVALYALHSTPVTAMLTATDTITDAIANYAVPAVQGATRRTQNIIRNIGSTSIGLRVSNHVVQPVVSTLNAGWNEARIRTSGVLGISVFGQEPFRPGGTSLTASNSTLSASTLSVPHTDSSSSDSSTHAAAVD